MSVYDTQHKMQRFVLVKLVRVHKVVLSFSLEQNNGTATNSCPTDAQCGETWETSEYQ
jgi:hypothetical protein